MSNFDRDLDQRLSFIESFLTPQKRLVIDGSMKLLQGWVEAVENGQLQASPEEIAKTKASIEEHRKALAGSLPPVDIRSN